ncbi:MAG: isochorismatase family protein [Armatimonadetes bacterium]|nr:isochorismatase family protein [Armatimonadota bacterium]
MRIWDDVLPEKDRQVYELGGFGARQGWGSRPAVLVIDVNYAFVGHRPEPILESVRRWPYSCGLQGWEGVRHIASLLNAARRAGLPVVYTTNAREDTHRPGTMKNARGAEEVKIPDFPHDGADIVAEITPQPGELLLRKPRASAFFGTPLASYLVGLGVDSLILTGTTTSGCVRASAVDGHAYNFKVAVVEECVFDRFEISHKISLFDMHAKYADIVRLAEVMEFVERMTAAPKAAVSR